MSKKDFLDALRRKKRDGKLVFGAGTSIVCQDLMNAARVYFPEAHMDADKMAALASTGHTLLGMDVVMPLFSVCHEAAAMGCAVNWGHANAMPESGSPIFSDVDDIHIPPDLLLHPGCATPLTAISILKKRLGDDAAVCGKVFGSWTQAYHYFGVEKFLMMTLDDPKKVHTILDKLLAITVTFANAQIEAGADCILLADHATRDLCSPQSYEIYLKPLHTRLAETIPCPLILHICGNTSDRIEMISQTGISCFHYDTKTGSPATVRGLAGNTLSLMGGISNKKLLNGSPEDIIADVKQAAINGVDIIGPECAIPLQTPLENVRAIASVDSLSDIMETE